MKAEVILSALDRIRDTVTACTDSNGEIPVGPVRMEIVLEFCQTEINKMIQSAKCRFCNTRLNHTKTIWR